MEKKKIKTKEYQKKQDEKQKYTKESWAFMLQDRIFQSIFQFLFCELQRNQEVLLITNDKSIIPFCEFLTFMRQFLNDLSPNLIHLNSCVPFWSVEPHHFYLRKNESRSRCKISVYPKSSAMIKLAGFGYQVT